MITEIYIGTDKLDLYEDENIVITSSIANIQELDKIYTDYGRSINIPATAKNNKILKHWYSSSVVDGFDNRVKKSGKISIGGGDFRYGKFKIDSVSMQGKKPVNYSLSYTGNLVEIKDKVGDDNLSDLDLSIFDFPYTSDSVFINLTGGEFQPSILASLITSKRMVYDSTETVEESETLSNVYYNNDDANSGISWKEFKFSIRVQKILDAIANDYGIVFSDDFTKQSSFSKMYLLLDKQTDEMLANEQIPFISTNDPLVDLPTSSIPTKPSGDRFYFEINTNSDANYRFVAKSEDEEIWSKNLKGDTSFSWSSVRPDLTFWLESESEFEYDFQMERRENLFPNTTYTTTTPTTTLNNTFTISENIPDMSVYDFIQGLVKLDKLVVVPQDDGTLYLDTLQDYYKKGNLYREFERYIDVSSFTITPTEKNSSINYAFSEPNTILNLKYTELNDRGFGDYTKTIKDDNGSVIDGDELDYEVPFEQVIYEAIQDIGLENTSTDGLVYGLITDEDLSPTNTSGHLHYVYSSNSAFGSEGIKIIDDSGVGIRFNQSCNMPSHSDYAESPLNSLVFGQEINIYTGDVIDRTLYTNRQENYINKISNKQSRYYNLSAKNVHTNIINNLKLNDVLEIRGQLFRIDKMEVNIINRDIEFYLFNDINIDLNYIEPITWDRTDITWDSEETTFDNI